MFKKAFIFDVDGTLVDAYPAIVESFNYTMRRIGYPVEKAEKIKKAVGWGDIKLLEPFVERGDLDPAIRVYRAHHLKSLKRLSRLKPYAKSLLLYLRLKGISLSIASNRPTRFTRVILKKLNIISFFDHILCADKIKRGKPDPLILNLLAKKIGLNKKYICYVGDMALDVKTGKSARIDTVAVATGSSSIPELKKAGPVFLFKDLKALKRRLPYLTT